jgi:hypothetical protein
MPPVVMVGSPRDLGVMPSEFEGYIDRSAWAEIARAYVSCADSSHGAVCMGETLCCVFCCSCLPIPFLFHPCVSHLHLQNQLQEYVLIIITSFEYSLFD